MTAISYLKAGARKALRHTATIFLLLPLALALPIYATAKYIAPKNFDDNATYLRNEESWNATTWDYSVTLDKGLFYPLPPRVDPKGKFHLIRRDATVSLNDNGKEFVLCKKCDFFDSTTVRVADIDFDGKPEFFIMLGAGSAGDFYMMTDEHGTDAPVKRLFSPYLEELSYYHNYKKQRGFIFDGLDLNKNNKTMLLSSGGAWDITRRSFAFRNGTYKLISYGYTWPGSRQKMDGSISPDVGIRFVTIFTLNEEKKEWTRSAETSNGHSSTMLALKDAPVFTQKNTQEWEHPAYIKIWSNKKEFANPANAKTHAKHAKDKPVAFTLDKQVANLPKDTWVKLLDIADKNNGKAKAVESWCKVLFTIKENNQEQEITGWVPAAAIFSHAKINFYQEPSTTKLKPDVYMDTFYIYESVTNQEGVWHHVQEDSYSLWVKQTDLKKSLQTE